MNKIQVKTSKCLFGKLRLQDERNAEQEIKNEEDKRKEERK